MKEPKKTITLNVYGTRTDHVLKKFTTIYHAIKVKPGEPDKSGMEIKSAIAPYELFNELKPYDSAMPCEIEFILPDKHSENTGFSVIGIAKK